MLEVDDRPMKGLRQHEGCHIQLDILLVVNTAREISAARRAAGLTQMELAERSGTSQATISAYEHSTKTPSSVTLTRVLAAAGRRLTTAPASAPVCAPSADELEHRGRVLAQVLDLAERLPAGRPRRLAYPRLATAGRPSAA
jgi:transcriptional regulator with XRE-family HTH domain